MRTLLIILMVALLLALPTLLPTAEAREIKVCQEPTESRSNRTSEGIFVFTVSAPVLGDAPRGIVQGVFPSDADTGEGKGTLYFPEAMLADIQSGLLMVDKFQAICGEDGLAGVLLMLHDLSGTQRFVGLISLTRQESLAGRYPANLQIDGHPAAQMDGAILVVSAADGPMP